MGFHCRRLKHSFHVQILCPVTASSITVSEVESLAYSETTYHRPWTCTVPLDLESDIMESLMKLFSLSGKTAVVTGGTRGIGAAMAIGLAEAGADIILIQVLSLPASR